MVSQENVVHKVLQDLLEQEVDQVLLAQKVPRYSQSVFLFCYSATIWVNFVFSNYFLLLLRVLLAHLVPLEAQDCLAYRECQEKEELLEALDQKGRG